MKRSIVFAVLILFSLLLAAQEQEPEQVPVLPDEQAQPAPQQAVEPPPAPGRDLQRVRIPMAFVHAGKEFPAGNYWLVLTEKDGQRSFVVQDERREPLFEELAIAMPHRGGGGFQVSRKLTSGDEFFRVRVNAPGEWLLGFFLIKK
ncbi:MAG TPA: hypothetical protein PK919_05070 [Candidatus Aminicenantes bacterium]|nr:hypothetical protein [Candidatus Aminicenantes bacterium]